MKARLSGIFFVSGLSGLVFETLWFRQAGLVFGNGVWAASLVLSSFMAGLALGNGLAARYGDRIAHPLRWYACIEAVIAAGGVALVVVLPELSDLLAPLLRPFQDQLLVLNPLRFVLAFALLLLPSIAMGATLPLLVSAVSSDEQDFGPSLGLLYGFNTLGAVAGCVATELVLIARFGVLGSAWTAAFANLAVAAAALALGRGVSPARPEVQPQRTGRELSFGVLRHLLAAGLAGFALLALEVVWFRFLLLFISGTSRSFALMLAVVLAGIGVGSLFAALLDRRFPRAYRQVWAWALAAGVCGVLTYSVFGSVLRGHGSRFAVDTGDVLRLGLTLMGPVSVLSGVIFTFLGRTLRDEISRTAGSTGLLTLANTLGAALGPLAAGFVLLPRLGMERSIFFLVLVYGAVGLASARMPAGRTGRLAAAFVVGCFALAALLFPLGRMDASYMSIVRARFESRGARIVAMREGLTETIHYARYDFLGEPISYQLVTNGFSMSASGLIGRRYMSLFVHLPAALHGDLRDALLISYGVGTTASALVETRSIERIDVVDISRDVLELSEVVHGEADPLRDPRVRIHVEDGRHYLQTTRRSFDLITGEPPPLKYAGVEYLYTREYFELARARLKPGGMMSYWLPVYQLDPDEFRSVVAAFCGAFDDCSLWSGNGLEWILLGSRDASRRPSEAEFSAPWTDAQVGRTLRRIGVESPWQLGALFIAGPGPLRKLSKGAPPLDDDHPQRLGNRLQTTTTGFAHYLDLMDTRKTRARFERSPLVAAWWPPGLRAQTLERFDVQSKINQYFNPLEEPTTARRLESLDEILDGTDLQTLPLWLLGTDEDEVQIAERLAERGGADPEVAYRLGARALSRRDAEGAVAHFRTAAQAAEPPRHAEPALAYALARAGRLDEVRALEHQSRSNRSRADRDDSGAWAWLRRRFGD